MNLLDPYEFMVVVFVGGAVIMAATMLIGWIKRVNAAVEKIEQSEPTTPKR